eukprot:161231-Amphidinium_carterae.1
MPNPCQLCLVMRNLSPGIIQKECTVETTFALTSEATHGVEGFPGLAPLRFNFPAQLLTPTPLVRSEQLLRRVGKVLYPRIQGKRGHIHRDARHAREKARMVSDKI